MSKKSMLFAIAGVSAALFVLSAVASASENHIEGATGQQFTGSGAGGNLQSEGEPTINCTKTTAIGSFTSETTGKVNLTFTGCNATILGVKLSCSTPEAAAETIKIENVVHLITVEGITGKTGILLTPPFPTINCGSGLSERKLSITGNGVIGTVSSPLCGEASKSMTVSFTSTAGSQEHKKYTGVTYDLTVDTEPNPTGATAGISGSATMTFNDNAARKLVCT